MAVNAAVAVRFGVAVVVTATVGDEVGDAPGVDPAAAAAAGVGVQIACASTAVAYGLKATAPEHIAVAASRRTNSRVFLNVMQLLH